MPTTFVIVSLDMDCRELDLVVETAEPAPAGEGVPAEWRDMRKTCSKVGLPASLAWSCHLGEEAGSGDAAEEGK